MRLQGAPAHSVHPPPRAASLFFVRAHKKMPPPPPASTALVPLPRRGAHPGPSLDLAGPFCEPPAVTVTKLTYEDGAVYEVGPRGDGKGWRWRDAQPL